MAKTSVPSLTLNDSNTIPQFGLGVWQTEDGEQVEAAVKAALAAGYRLIDTAAAYGNEEGVGKAIRESGIPREEIFLTTKLWNADQGYEATLSAIDTSLSKLGMDYVDLYLIHWPVPAKGLYKDSWRALEKIKADGKARSIGVSNFTPRILEDLATSSDTVPAVNQIELHPRYNQAETRAYAKDHGIAIESYSPLGSTGAPVLDEPVLQEIAQRVNKTPAQIVLRWQIQLGNIVIPKSTHKERIEENFKIFDFELSPEDVDAINKLETGKRGAPDPETANF